MGETENDQRSNPERENRILDAAARLILHYGYDKTTVSEIAKEAGVSKGAIYLHWKSKDDLFEALLWREIWVFVENWLGQIDERDDIDTFAALYKNMLGEVKKRPLIMAMYTRDKRILSQKFLARYERFFTLRFTVGSETFQYLQQVGVIRKDIDVNVTAYIMAMMAYGFMKVDEAIPPELAPPLDDVVEQFGVILDQMLTPADGGNAEALRQIMKQMMSSYKTKIEQGELGGKSNGE